MLAVVVVALAAIGSNSMSRLEAQAKLVKSGSDIKDRLLPVSTSWIIFISFGCCFENAGSMGQRNLEIGF